MGTPGRKRHTKGTEVLERGALQPCLTTFFSGDQDWFLKPL